MRPEEAEPELGPYQLALVVLTVTLLLGLAAETVLPVPREIRRLIEFLDTAICALLLVDFATRFWQAPDKLRFMRWGWIDLLASLPAVDTLRWGRVFRLLRVLRVIIALRSLQRLFTLLLGQRRQTGIASLLVFTFLIVAFGSTGILLAETSGNANIRTAEDALWWAMTTITTVGYGDRYPVTDIGRMVASLMMIGGIGLFGTLSGVAASFFLGGSPAPAPAAEPALRDLEARVARLENEAAATPLSRGAGDRG
jgi:voltage-gated potassium channel